MGKDDKGGVSLIHSETPNEFRSAIAELNRNLPYLIDMATITAAVRKANYDALIKEGFDEKQALELCKYTDL